MKTDAIESVVGTILNGRYKIVRVLSAGAFGQIYIAEDTWLSNNVQCVVKHLQPKGDAPRRWQICDRHFAREVETLKKLGDHSQIPQLLDSFEDKQGFYLVQELIVGELLSAGLPISQHDNKRWSEAQCVELLKDVLGILEFVHGNKIIHGDIKPNNLIRRTSDDRFVLIDFGAAQEIHPPPDNPQAIPVERPKVPVAIRSLGYVPAEQLSGLPYPNSDLYALGMIVIQALTGVSPSQLQSDPHTGEVLWQQQVSVSDRLACVIDRLVRYDFKERYQSASDALTVLKSLGMGSKRQGVSKEEVSNQFVSYSPPVVPPSMTLKDIGELEQCLHNVSHLKNGSSQKLSTNSNSFLSSVVVGESAQPSDTLKPAGQENEMDAVTPSALELAAKSTESQADYQTSSTSGKLFYARELAISCCPKLPPLLTGMGAGMATSNAVAISLGLYTLLHTAPSNPGLDILARATEKYQAGQFNEAIALANSVPSDSAAYQASLTAVQKWHSEWNLAATQLKAVEAAFYDQRWRDVFEEANKTPNIVYWQQKIEPFVLAAKPKLEEEAQSLLQQAYKQAREKDFTGALAYLKQIPLETPTGAKIKPKLDEYSQKQQVRADYLLQRAYEQSGKRDFSSALKYLAQIPQETPAYEKAQAKIAEYSLKQTFKEEVERQAKLNANFPKEDLTPPKLSQVPDSSKTSKNLNPGNRFQETSPQRFLPTSAKR